MKKKVLKKQNNGYNCFVCGERNNAGLHTEFYELEDDTIVGLATAQSFHQSYPGRVHGGVITALLDEVIGRVVNIKEPETWGVTVEMETRFKHPVPYDVPLIVTGRMLDNNRRVYRAEGEVILPDGTVAAYASARYMKMRLADIADFEAAGEVWEVHPREDDPTEIEIPEPPAKARRG